MKKYDLSKVFSLAWQMVKNNNYSMSDALKVAWLNIKLQVRLAKEIVSFQFTKKDGSIRNAVGTLFNLNIVRSSENRKRNDMVQVYFDIEKNEFRCFKKENLMFIY